MLLYSYLNPSIKRRVKYILKPSHSNILESITILKSLKKVGINIFSIDHDSNASLDFKKVSHVFGYGKPVFQAISNSINRQINVIHYLTGSEKHFQNNAELKRVYYFNNKYLANYTPRRLVNEPHSLEDFYIKKVILIGNNKTKSTYQEKMNKGVNIKTINATSPIEVHYEKDNYPWEKFRNNKIKRILFLSGSGLVHKGLDLVIEAIKKLNSPNIELHIMGPYEQDFFDPLKNQIAELNVVHHGFKDLRSSITKKIIENCDFLISPSCSEGQSTSVLAGMACGLVPIITEECGVNINENIFSLNSHSINEIAGVIDNALSLNFISYRNKSENVMNLIRDNHQINQFQETLENYLFEFGFYNS